MILMVVSVADVVSCSVGRYVDGVDRLSLPTQRLAFVEGQDVVNRVEDIVVLVRGTSVLAA